MSRTKLALPVVLLLVSGCMTESMGRSLSNALDLGPSTRVDRRQRSSSVLSTYDRDQGLPDRIWYVDPVAQIYHERRTNTFIAFDADHKGWIAVSRESAFKDFKPERAHLLAQKPPGEVERVLDYVTEMDPDWHGLN